MSFFIVKGDLFEQKVDAIVIPSQPSLALEGAVGGKAKKICGDLLVEELKQCKMLQFGDCVIANSYTDHFKKVILVANPKWQGGDFDEEMNLEFSYESCLKKAKKFGSSSIAFPLLSTGTYKFPIDNAINIARATIRRFLAKNDCLTVYLVMPDENIFNEFEKLEKYRPILTHYDEKAVEANLDGTDQVKFATVLKNYLLACNKPKRDCYDLIVSKTMFNNYLNGKSVPKKQTAVALGIQMGLGVTDINVLLAPLGEMLNPQVAADKIVIDSINNKEEQNTVDSINDKLKQGNYPLLKGE